MIKKTVKFTVAIETEPMERLSHLAFTKGMSRKRVAERIIEWFLGLDKEAQEEIVRHFLPYEGMGKSWTPSSFHLKVKKT